MHGLHGLQKNRKTKCYEDKYRAQPGDTGRHTPAPPHHWEVPPPCGRGTPRVGGGAPPHSLPHQWEAPPLWKGDPQGEGERPSGDPPSLGHRGAMVSSTDCRFAGRWFESRCALCLLDNKFCVMLGNTCPPSLANTKQEAIRKLPERLVVQPDGRKLCLF